MTPAEKFHDAVMRLPAVCLNLYFIIHEVSELQRWLGGHPYWSDDRAFLLALVSRVALIVFLVLLALLHLTRRRPVRKHEAWLPKIEALLGVGFFYLLLLLPRAAADPLWDTASTVLIILGNILCIVAVLDLGRSLSVMPEARRLVTEGIYRYVRHPLYLSEGLAMIGIFLQFRSWGALAIVFVEFFWQWRRMGWEERILGAAFPDYSAYRQRTARLLPGVY